MADTIGKQTTQLTNDTASLANTLAPGFTGNIDLGTTSIPFSNLYIQTANVLGNLVAGNIVGGGVRSTTSSSAPSNPVVGDIWYNSLTDIKYRYTFDGTSSYWVDYDSTVTGATYYSANLVISDISPSQNVTYSLGNVTSYFANSFVSNSYVANNQVIGGSLTVTGNIVAGNIVAGGVRSTTAATAPLNPVVGDIWYNSSTDDIYRYTQDASSSYWLDINGPTVANASPAYVSIATLKSVVFNSKYKSRNSSLPQAVKPLLSSFSILGISSITCFIPKEIIIPYSCNKPLIWFA